MRKLFLIIVSLVLTFPVLGQKKSEILEIMKRQETHWNNGDIDQFMEDYWKSPELKFIGKNGVTKGWQATKDRYFKSYPDRVLPWVHLRLISRKLISFLKKQPGF